MAKDPLAGQTVPTKELAEELSRILGCSGSHRVGDDAWGPCQSPRDLMKLIELGNPAFRDWKKNQTGKKVVVGIMRMKAAKTKGVFKKNTMSRKLSRLSARIKQIA